MPLKRQDFVEIEFTGKIKDGGVFDSNIKEEVEKLHKGHDHPIETKPLIISLGQGMFLKGVEDFLIDKELGEYNIELAPENAFGKRESRLIQRIPILVFHQQKINPIPGAVFNFDGRIGRVLASSGGRVLVDFNNPLAGKDVSYKVKVLRVVEDLNEKIKALNDFLFRRDFNFEVKDKTLILEVDKKMKPFLELFKPKYKEILDLDLEFKEIEEKKEEKDEKIESEESEKEENTEDNP
jgi:FKBP-type peptidyl-prolyl cis-trans isomerase 2